MKVRRCCHEGMQGVCWKQQRVRTHRLRSDDMLLMGGSMPMQSKHCNGMHIHMTHTHTCNTSNAPHICVCAFLFCTFAPDPHAPLPTP